jgi:hypothetical protein
MRPVKLTAVLGVLFLAAPAGAQTFNDPRVVGMAGAVVGDPLHNSALFTNPAGMARAYTYAAEAIYDRVGPGALNAVGADVVDSKTQPALAVGAGYGYIFSDPSEDVGVSGHDVRLGFAHAIAPNSAFAGMTLHYIHLNRDAPLEDTKGFTLDAGALFSLSPNFHVGLVGKNLIDQHDPEFPRQAGGGIAYTGDVLTIDFDTLADFSTADSTKPVFRLGAEAIISDSFPLRAGVERNQATEQTFVAGGIGFLSSGEAGTNGTQLNVSFRQNLDQTKNYQLAVGLTIFM